MERERKLQLAMEQVALKEKELLDLKSENEELKGRVQKLEKDRGDLETKVIELCAQKKEAETGKEHHGYEMLLFDKLDPIKVVHNGALVDDNEVDVKGGDDHNPKA
ncbi:hypothetical protein PIB30_077464 [Stylosanthes scabra]|uniref:Uncharacterized protein n=1 Tax=Stylosanthes scabra TaxID=79078 RepID=A0ABU6VQW7_9FABA|nr:hypothetical protein [Stylosanthes scabra]